MENHRLRGRTGQAREMRIRIKLPGKQEAGFKRSKCEEGQTRSHSRMASRRGQVRDVNGAANKAEKSYGNWKPKAVI